MDKSLLKDKRGLTLIELMIGVAILAIITVPLLNTFIVGAGTEKKSREYGNATEAAQNISEQIQAENIDGILSDSSRVDSDAGFYTYDGGTDTYIPAGLTPPEIKNGNSKLYYIGIPNYSYGGSVFDAMVTLSLDTTDSDNSADVSVSNQMGTYFDMNGADANAALALKSECGYLENPNGQAELSIGMLTRTVTFNISDKISESLSETHDYNIELLFEYSGWITGTVDDGNGDGPRTESVYFSHTEKSSASIVSVADTSDGSPVFSVYTFFDGYYKDNIGDENILINNSTGHDINIFLVNTNETATAASYTIWYKYQCFNDQLDDPVNKLVYTNLPGNIITYRAFLDNMQRRTMDVSEYLVETRQYDRKYGLDIKMFKAGSDFSGTPILDFESEKLN